jgi:diguanylate cyclase (GGDEF)-like protein/PAS domain S-box-containing protein
MTERRIVRLGLLRRIGLLLLAGVGVGVSFRQAGLGGLLASLCVVLVLGGLLAFYQRRNRIIEALQRSQQQLHEAQRLAGIGSWEFDLIANEIFWSDELYKIFEIDPTQGPGDYARFLEMVHPDDRKQVDLAYKNALDNHLSYEIEHRVVTVDGRIKQIRERGETLYADDGTPLRSIGTAQDITDIRRMEAQMELLGTAFQHSGEAILITDHDNRILTVNPAFTTLTGYTQEEVVGRNPSVLSAGRSTPEDYAKMWEAIKQNGYWQGEIWDRRKDGGIYPKWLSISAILNEAGGVRYYMAHFTDISAERAAEAKLHHMAHHDMLTGLYNRYSLKDRLEHSLAVARRNSGRVALMFIDLDRFKVINDTLGHHVGDELLIEVGKRLLSCVRESDMVARLGGDEFVVMLTGMDHSSSAAMIAEKVLVSIGESYAVGPHILYTSPSIGIAIYPMDGNDSESLMKNADAAMYHAKNAGRNNFQFFDAKMNEAALERLAVEHALHQALGREEFRLHFQPIMDVNTGRVASVEALIRWQHPEKGLLSPALFIGVAEETGLIQPIGEWVFWAACRQLADFRAAGISDVKMGINISAVQMRNSDLALLAKGAITAHSLVPGDLIFEITESVAMAHPDETVRVLDVLHDMGVTLALDDFGTGYSSLSYLRMFPLDKLKLDRSFVEEIGQNIDGQVICDATIGLAQNLGLQLIAEGVETEEQLEYLKARGCSLVQGYLFSRPIPGDEVMAFIREHNGYPVAH